MSDLYHQAPHSHVSLHHSPPPVSIWTSAQTHTHNRLTALCPGLAGWAGTRKVKPVWILLKQETMSGSGISLTVCKSAHRSRQISTPPLSFYRSDALRAAQPTVSKHRHTINNNHVWHSGAMGTVSNWQSRGRGFNCGRGMAALLIKTMCKLFAAFCPRHQTV